MDSVWLLYTHQLRRCRENSREPVQICARNTPVDTSVASVFTEACLYWNRSSSNMAAARLQEKPTGPTIVAGRKFSRLFTTILDSWIKVCGFGLSGSVFIILVEKNRLSTWNKASIISTCLLDSNINVS